MRVRGVRARGPDPRPQGRGPVECESWYRKQAQPPGAQCRTSRSKPHPTTPENTVPISATDYALEGPTEDDFAYRVLKYGFDDFWFAAP